MAAKEIKNELKSARDLIQKKDYQGALKHCKAVLKLDKTNYNAFVFVGVASIELGKLENAQAAYRKAIETNSENILAWQGLASLHEKEPDFGNKEDFIEVYNRLMKHYESNDKKKWSDVVLKLADLHKSLKNYNEALDLLRLLQDADCEKDQHSLWSKFIALLQDNIENLTCAQTNELVSVYKNILEGNIESNDKTRQYYEDYIKLLLRNDTSVDDIILEAKRMNDICGKNEFALNILAKMYLENILEVNDEERMIYEELLTVNPKSCQACLGLGKMDLFKKDFILAEKHFRNGLQSLPNSSLCWYFLSQTQLLRHQHEDSFHSSTKGLENLKNDNIFHNRNSILFYLSLCNVKSSWRSGKEGITTAIIQLQELLTQQPNNLEGHLELGKIFVRMNNLMEAKKCLENARNIDEKSSKCFILEGEISTAKDDFENAVRSFQRGIEVNEDVAECYLNLGKLYWKMEENSENSEKSGKCLEYLLKSAKIDSYNSSTFLYLGYYYQNVGLDSNKALRCFKKAHSLNPLCHEVGEALADVYMNLEQQEEAAKLCRKFTVNLGIGRAKWAFLRLGLYHLKQEQYNDAVHCFQNAVRVDPEDAHALECLGEAYLSRGSYIPALTSFTRATELNSSLLYSQYQIAFVRHLLGQFDEAVVVYKSILSEHCDYVPGLKGLGETYISCAKSSLQQDFHGRAVDYIQNAVIVFARAIKYDGNLSCLWKLLGDACSLVFNINKSKIRIKLPENLKKFLNVEEDAMASKMDILSLAASSYTQAVRFNSLCPSLWHDVGLSYFRLSTIQKDQSERRRLCERSMKALKKGLNMEPSNYIIWNTLGIVAASNYINNPELSQHSFIKSILSQKNAMAWTDLGVLYLRHGKADMANMAFNEAQCIDPSYTQAWIGQATIAEIFAHNEAMDLYRHSTELGTHTESYLGYANWVCHTLLSISSNDQTSCILKGKPYADLSHLPPKFRNIVLIASLGLSNYTDQIQDDACAYNMYGILLEHQELYNQAVKAYSCSLQLLKNSESPNQNHCNIVRENYARVLCAVGEYSESIKIFQEIKPINNFYCITGLALAFFMLGNLQQSYQAYEQAFELATDDSQKSHVYAAMGMLKFISSDVDKAKVILCESSELCPASDQGLLALSSLGLITSDLTLAAAALAELVKIGEKGNEHLIAEASYLFASFYALQGSTCIGKSYIVKEIHRRPHSSLLWNNLARFIIRYQPNKLNDAGRCAVAAHTLGDRNVEYVSTSYAYSSIGCGYDSVSGKSLKILPGLISAQKAVHMNPSCVTNWSLLSAALSDSCRRSQKKSINLCEMITQFSLTKAIEVSQYPSTKLDIVERRELNIAEARKKWLALQFGYSLYYSKKTKEAIQHCRQALEIWKTDTIFCAKLKLLLVEISSCREDNMNSLEDVTSVLILNQDNCYAWLFSALFHEQQGLIKAAEFCYGNCLQLASRQRLLHVKIISLVRLAHLALRKVMMQADTAHWLELIMEASSEVLKILPTCSVAILLLGIAHYMQNHIREGKDAFRMLETTGSDFNDLANFYLVLLSMRKPDKGETVNDVIERATRENLGHSLQDILLYLMAMNVDGLARKRLLIKCVHVNPSEIKFWNALHES